LQLEGLRVWRDVRDGVCYARAVVGPALAGHPGIAHGGLISALLDNTLGYAFFATGLGNGYTASLHVNYKRPLLCGRPVEVVSPRPSPPSPAAVGPS
jgi:acyl-coenzyme A thioesterase PaaI-like protein